MGTPASLSYDGPRQIRLSLLDGEYSVCKLNADYDPGQQRTGILSITVKERETSLVCTTGQEPEKATIEPGWRALYVNGQIAFGLTGVVAGITSTVASAGLPVFVISTFDSDLLFLKQDTLIDALAALAVSGYAIGEESVAPPPNPGIGCRCSPPSAAALPALGGYTAFWSQACFARPTKLLAELSVTRSDGRVICRRATVVFGNGQLTKRRCPISDGASPPQFCQCYQAARFPKCPQWLSVSGLPSLMALPRSRLGFLPPGHDCRPWHGRFVGP